VLTVSEGTDDGDVFIAGFVERQEIVFVAEEDGGALGGVKGFGAVSWVVEDFLRVGDVDVRALEEAELDLGFEDGFYGGVDLGEGDLALLKGLGKGGVVGLADGHLHVEAGVEGAECGVCGVFGEAVVLEALDGVGVGDGEALELPIFAEDIGEEPVVAGGGDVIEVHVGAHDGAGTGFDASVEGREVDVVELCVGDVGGVVVTPALRCSITRKVFEAGEHVVRGADSWTLEAADLGAGDGGAEVGIFSGAFHDAAPARIAGDVEHGGEGPVDADRTGFSSGDGLGALYCLRIPGRGHGERDRKDGAEAVDDVEPEDERNVQARVVDGEMLETIDLDGVGDEEEGADLALADLLIHLGGWSEAEELVELTELFFGSHLLE